MTDKRFAACATRAREAGGVSALALLFLFGALACAVPRTTARAQETSNPAGAASIVGAWHATLPTGLHIATLTVVPDGEGFGASCACAGRAAHANANVASVSRAASADEPPASRARVAHAANLLSVM